MATKEEEEEVQKRMISAGAGHAQSVFNNSCCSMPTSLSPNRPATAPSPKVKPLSSSRSCHTSHRTKELPSEAAKSGLLESCLQSQPIPSLDATLKQKTDYETLFKTLLENNALLHNEVSRLKREHSKAITRLSQYYENCLRNQQAEQPQRGRHVTANLKDTTSYSNNVLSTPPPPGMRTKSARSVKSHAEQAGRSVISPAIARLTPQAAKEKDTMEESSRWAKPAKIKNLMRDDGDQYETPEEFVSPASSVNDCDRLSVTSIETYQITYISSPSSVDENEGAQANPSRYQSPGMMAVGKMWENFSVDDFPVLDFSEALPCNLQNRGMSGKSKRHQPPLSPSTSRASPSVTVPKPFKMTVRDANTMKKKNRSMVILEKDVTQKQAVEESECMKRFHANPMPASTLLPLYDLINAKNEQRREIVKRMSANALKANQKPFKFCQRDEERREKIAQLQKEAQEDEERRIKRMAHFKAKPMSPKVLDRAIDEEALEKEEYRKIKIQMRSEKLLADAKAPSSMQLTEAKKKKTTKSPVAKKPKGSAKPKINHIIPNYDKAYSKFQRELATKRQSRLVTVVEPFRLHTEKRAKVRPQTESTSSGAPSHSDKPTLRTVSNPAPPTFQMTETVRLRRMLAKEKLAEATENEGRLENEMRAKRTKAKAVQKLVAQRSSVFDLTEEMSEKRKNKAEEIR